MTKMTAQEVFNAAYIGVMKQGKRSVPEGL